MAVSEAQKAQILSLGETMSVRQIAERTSVPKSTVAYILKKASGMPKAAPPRRNVQQPEVIPASAHAHAPAYYEGRPIVQLSNRPTEPLSPSMVASIALDHLITEMDIYKRALKEAEMADFKDKATAEWKVISHEKLVQSHLRTIAQWFGMDKGDVLKAIEDIRNDPFATMSKDELLKLYEVTQ